MRYIRDADGGVKYVRSLRLGALRNGLDIYRDKYHWTGGGTTEPTSTIKGQEAYLTIKKNVWQFYEVRLDRTLNKGEQLVDME